MNKDDITRARRNKMYKTKQNKPKNPTVGSHTAPSRANDVQFGGDHYKNMGVEPWDVVDTWPREQRIGYYRGGALKYIMRMGNKDESPTEIAKGAHYMQKLLEVLNEQLE